MTRWEAQLRGVQTLQGLLDRFLSVLVQQRCLYFLEASLHHRYLCALEVMLVEEPFVWQRHGYCLGLGGI